MAKIKINEIEKDLYRDITNQEASQMIGGANPAFSDQDILELNRQLSEETERAEFFSNILSKFSDITKTLLEAQ